MSPAESPETPPFDLIVVGAGPAGLSAALDAADHGLRVVVIDEQYAPGGQIFRQPPATFSHPAAAPAYPFGADLLQRARADQRIDWRYGQTAWGVFRDTDREGLRLGVASAEQAELIAGKALLIATGAYDLPVAFPGWTLPGVMSAGGVQTLLKSQFLRPGSRFVLAGSHPLLLLVADLLLKAGAEVAEVAIARPRPGVRELLASWRAVPGHVGLMLQMARALWNLKRHRVPLRFSTLIQSAAGGEAVNSVTLAGVDADWKALPGSERTLAADTLVIGYGLLASTELARQAGCAVDYREAAGGWVVVRDAAMRSSVRGVWVAGEPGGIGGAEMAHLEGRLAALDIARALGFIATPAPQQADAALSRLQQALRRAHHFSDVVLRFFAPNMVALARLASGDTLICRCEEVGADTVREFLSANPHVGDINSVKLACRTGMGMCQGRYCQHTSAQILAEATGKPVDCLGHFTARAPVKPVSVISLAKLRLPH
ncbi:FAD-dependent oxidoreductase [Duganella phyllosphaerae]|uniref:Hydrogen cyanide synthase subunit HcnB n=1 Tax=Duganella phyllosphaerae TaxID=762836 RepID=A0A1E7WUS1_9BURK|nr:FAD-dependent oxidoreductase [Duganella phyllosphaerae]OFA03462.1 hydrogen cyanide synthase subunit HcnB [Duganella phyllosphaerae]